MPSPIETDRIEAAKAVLAAQRKDDRAFRQIIDDAFARYGGPERMIRILAEQLAQGQQ